MKINYFYNHTHMKPNAYLPIAALILASMTSAIKASEPPAGNDGIEKLSRGVVVLPKDNGQFVSWRFLATDPPSTTFDILRDGKAVKTDYKAATSWFDAGGTPQSKYSIVTKTGLGPNDTTAAVTPWSDVFKQVKLDKPQQGTTPDGKEYAYTPNDCSVGDVDGDGDYEIILKWDPSNSKDNAFDGYTGNVLIDCYKLDGTRLWRIDLGPNIRAGAHYTQFMVYDFDGNGRAEMICKTAPGSIDGTGTYVTEAATQGAIKSTDNSADYRNGSGRILSGPEYLTVFNGETGKAIHTVYYNPNRAGTLGGAPGHPSEGFWGDSFGNRGERYLACVAFLGGKEANPSAVMCRGYYGLAYLWAVDFDGNKLSTRWLHASINERLVQTTDRSGRKTTKTYTSNTSGKANGSNTVYANGNHNISVADVDGDGRDEILYGSAAVDDDGELLYATGLGHGDAMHVADLDPDRPGLEVFQVHEGGVWPYGWDIHDAATGEIIAGEPGGGDNGKGMAADVIAGNRGYEYWSANDCRVRGIDGNVLGENGGSMVFRIYWDGDPYDEQLGDVSNHNNPFLEKYGDGRLYINGKNVYELGKSKNCNSTKGTPCLVADLFGDWREEIVLWSGSDSAHLNIFSTTISTPYRIATLMHDHVYRLGIAWQNVAYNQPPHLGYYLPDAIDGTEAASLAATESPGISEKRVYSLSGRYVGNTTEGLPEGIYLVRQTDGNTTTARKVVVNGRAHKSR